MPKTTKTCRAAAWFDGVFGILVAWPMGHALEGFLIKGGYGLSIIACGILLERFVKSGRRFGLVLLARTLVYLVGAAFFGYALLASGPEDYGDHRFGFYAFFAVLFLLFASNVVWSVWLFRRARLEEAKEGGQK